MFKIKFRTAIHDTQIEKSENYSNVEKKQFHRFRTNC